MVDAIVLLVVLVLIIFAVKGSIRHFRGEGPCCGGSVRKVEKRLSGVILGSKDILIEGMTCDNCASRVQNVLNRIDGLSASVDLARNNAHIEFTHLISDDDVREAIEKAGYKVIEIK